MGLVLAVHEHHPLGVPLSLTQPHHELAGVGMGETNYNDTGGSDTHVHDDHVLSHNLTGNMVAEVTGASLLPNAADNHTATHSEANHLPTWRGLPLEIRVDNSENP